MPTRNFKQYLIISAKGLAMGAADAVPGVSGGTIAFISGIYEELILTISNINLSLFKILKERGISEFWKQLNGNFIIALLAGIAVSFVSFMQLAKYLIENKYWVPVRRVDNAFGDRNLICACPSVESYVHLD